MLKKITLDNFRSFKNRVTVELAKTNYNMLSHNAADNGVLKGCIFVGANGSGKSTIICGIKLLLDLLFSEKTSIWAVSSVCLASAGIIPLSTSL